MKRKQTRREGMSIIDAVHNEFLVGIPKDYLSDDLLSDMPSDSDTISNRALQADIMAAVCTCDLENRSDYDVERLILDMVSYMSESLLVLEPYVRHHSTKELLDGVFAATRKEMSEEDFMAKGSAELESPMVKDIATEVWNRLSVNTLQCAGISLLIQGIIDGFNVQEGNTEGNEGIDRVRVVWEVERLLLEKGSSLGAFEPVLMLVQKIHERLPRVKKRVRGRVRNFVVKTLSDLLLVWECYGEIKKAFVRQYGEM